LSSKGGGLGLAGSAGSSLASGLVPLNLVGAQQSTGGLFGHAVVSGPAGGPEIKIRGRSATVGGSVTSARDDAASVKSAPRPPKPSNSKGFVNSNSSSNGEDG
jgi:hypothetical protein